MAAPSPALAARPGNAPDESTVGELLWTLTALAKQHDISAEIVLRCHAVISLRGRGG